MSNEPIKQIQFIPDEEIILHQKIQGEEGNDLLNTSTYADALARCIQSAPVKKTFTIGLFGEWGSGKSSIVKTAIKKITDKENAIGKKIGIVTYDAWKYSGDSFRRMFLLEVQQQLHLKAPSEFNRFYDNINEDVEVKHDTNNCYWYIAIGVLALICMLCLLIDSIPEKLGFGLSTITALLTIIINLKKYSTDDLKLTVQKSRIFAPEQFQACFESIIDEAHKKTSILHKLLHWNFKSDDTLAKIIITIDNIDRCQPEITYTLLSDIKSFLDNNEGVVFIIPVDVEAIRKHILNTKKTGHDNSHDADEFLRKCFQISIWIKPYHTDEMFEYADSLNKKYSLGFQPTTISVIANEFATNPRRIIQLFNNLLIEQLSYDEIFIRDNQPLICQLTIIREEFPDFYRQIQRDANLLFNLDTEGLKEKQNARLLLFLKRTYYISKRYEYELSTVDKILSNSNTSDSLTADIREAVLIPGTPDAIKAFIKDNEEKRQDVATYVLTSIRKTIDRGLVEADMVNQYPAFLYLVEANILTQAEINTFTNLMQSDDLWDKLIPNITPYLIMHVHFAHSLLKQNNHQLIDRYVNFINNISSEDKYSDDVRNSIFYACQELGADEIDSLKDAFHKAFTEDSLGVFAYRYPEASTLFTEELISEVIEHMKSDNILGQESPYQQFLQICSQIEPHKDDKNIINFFEKLHTLIPQYEYSRNNKDELRPFFEYLYELLLESDKLTISECDLVRKSTNRFTSRTQVGGRTRSMLLDNLDDTSLVTLFLNLFKTTCLITKEPIFCNNDIAQLMAHQEWQENTIHILYSLYSAGFDISHYHESILSVSNYSVEHQQMIKYLLSDNCPEERRMVDVEIVNELRTLVNNTIDDKNDNDYSSFLIDIAQISRIKEKLVDILKSLTLDKLEHLPKPLQSFAVSRFEENIENYSDTTSILQLIASCGTKSGIGKLARLINQKLSSPGEENVVLPVISKLYYLKPSDSRMLSTTIECLELPNLSEDDKKTYIEKIESVTRQ